MKKFIQYQTWEHLLLYLSKSLDLPFFELLKQPSFNQNIGLSYFRFDSWSELLAGLNLDRGVDIFGETTSNSNYLIDIQNTDISSLPIVLFASLDSLNLFLFSSERPKILASSKKKLKEAKVDLVDCEKIKPLEIKKLSQDYICQNHLKVSESILDKVTKKTSTLPESFNLIDSLAVLENPTLQTKFLELQSTREETNLFFLSFPPKNLAQKKVWLKASKEENLQLILAIVFNKLKKQGQDKLLLEVIEVDKKIKTLSKTPPLVWWKEFLWRV